MNNAPNLDLDTVRVLIGQARDGDQGAQSDLAEQVQKYLVTRADKQLDKSLRACIHQGNR